MKNSKNLNSQGPIRMVKTEDGHIEECTTKDDKRHGFCRAITLDKDTRKPRLAFQLWDKDAGMKDEVTGKVVIPLWLAGHEVLLGGEGPDLNRDGDTGGTFTDLTSAKIQCPDAGKCAVLGNFKNPAA